MAEEEAGGLCSKGFAADVCGVGLNEEGEASWLCTGVGTLALIAII